jgi:RHH-type proline utilization regulon transcriptional repressor/proline dehydrogenase/delta 1-pyrroline-5-carboxylate dehydrogenase
MSAPIFERPPSLDDPLRSAISALYRADEAACLGELLAIACLPDATRGAVAARARSLVQGVRAAGQGAGLDAFLSEYGLDSEEGVVLMCLAEALLRIPDRETADRLITDKLAEADWESHLGRSDSLFVNASTWGLMLTGRIIRLTEVEGVSPWTRFRQLVGRTGEPIIREAFLQAMRILGRQFVMGRTIEEALGLAREAENDRHSYDMLGEAARTMADAERYFEAYANAIAAIGADARARDLLKDDIFTRPSISVKLSALHPRYEYAQRRRVLDELAPRLLALARRAKEEGIGLTVDAEEADRLDLSLDLIAATYGHDTLGDWQGYGMAVQAYQKRAIRVIDWAAELARRSKRRMAIRLVKGAYWDSEIKWAQEKGLEGYPVFTRKASTDVSYLACAAKLLEAGDAFYPQFASHNAHTVASVIESASPGQPFEFQRLHGMGETLYGQIAGPEGPPCRVYAPVGSHEDLLPYLVRRLLENGANTSFVNRISDLDAPIEEITADPVAKTTQAEPKPHPKIPLPADLYGEGRRNARGLELSDPVMLSRLAGAIGDAIEKERQAGPIIGAELRAGAARPVTDPSDRRKVVGTVVEASAETTDEAIARAQGAFPEWSAVSAEERAACLERMADLMEGRMAELIALAVREAGKTLPDALAELREAVDYGRYYAQRARADFARPQILPGPTGEDNSIALEGRGVFACIAPWNFPLAIFTGQTTAALAAGNTVIAKPAEQTPLMAAAAVGLLHEAGVPPDALHLLPGPGEVIGARLTSDERIAGVAFTGSTETGRAINRVLAERDGPIVPLIAETGGQNAMIVDSSALPEQVVQDVVQSAFGSAGQRCSCLRVLFVQDDVAPRILPMLAGAMAEIKVGDPLRLSTDVGPVIDAEAKATLEAHAARMEKQATPIAQTPLPPETEQGSFVAPRAFEIDDIGILEREVFGPILHVVRYSSDRLDAVIESINGTGYGLTLGIHSRIESQADYILKRVRVGNCYVNRNVIGAVVGVQPFGGEGLSGTGPKAGGPRYLHRFATERTVSNNIVATGGNAALLSLAED